MPKYIAILLILITTPLPAAQPPQPPRATWLGQDAHDFCQTSSSTAPNDIQDLHLRLEHLPAGDPIVFAAIRRQGGGEWDYRGKGHWAAHLVQPENATTADLYLEPSHHEPACNLDIELHYRSGRGDTFGVKGGASNPNLFMPTAVLHAKWIGQSGPDWTGPTPAVGPDGFQDAEIALTGLATRLELQSLTIDDPQGAKWEYGTNPHRLGNAELLRDPKDPSRARLFFSPDRNLASHKLSLRINYTIDRNNSTQILADTTDPKRPAPKPAPFALTDSHLSIQWLGQDNATSRGDLHVTLTNLPPNRAILAAALSDVAGGYWIYRRDDKVDFYPPANRNDPPSLPLTIHRKDAAPSADLFFPPYRDESDTPMLLRLLLDDGSTLVCRFTGAKCDPYLRGPLPAPTTTDAKPGDDLQALAEKFGAIHLSSGRYILDKPLKLPSPITLTGDHDAILEFSQKPDGEPWTGALLIAASNTTLRGFSIRFAHDFRWKLNVSGGAAMIRAVHRANDPRANLTLENLDIEGPSVTPPADPKKTPEAACIIRFEGATSGRIIHNRFKGGTVDVFNGPWLIADNDYLGALPGTFVYDAFAGHWIHDYTLEHNRVRSTPRLSSPKSEPAGKTWRFLSTNQLGQRVTVRDNDISGVGMRDDDTLPNPNTPEILLTESYRLYFEGKPAAISNNGAILQIPIIMHGVIIPGSIVSILTGPHAGEYFTIAQPITPTTLLMAGPLPPGDYAISIAHGYVNTTIERNHIDVRGGQSALIVLAGNHWGLRLLDNHLQGGGEAMRIQSTPTENPFIWGWSHTPFLGMQLENNLCEDSRRGIAIDVYSDRHNKTSAARTYMSGVIRNNTLRGPTNPPFQIAKDTANPIEMKLTTQNNTPRPNP